MRLSLRRTLIGALLVAGFCAPALAQPVLRNDGWDDLRNGGEFSVQVQYLDTTGVGQRMPSLTTSGRDVTWDFSGLTKSGSVVPFSSTYVRVADARYNEHFPNATHVILDRSTGQDRYAFHIINSEIYEQLGSTPMTGQYMVNEGLINCTFPLNFGEGAERDLIQRMHVENMPNTIDLPGKSSYKYLGYGALKLAQGTFQNVIMINAFTSTSLFGTGSVLNTTTYNWTQGNLKEVIASLQLVETVIPDPFGGDTIRTYAYSFWHTPNQPSSRENANFVPASVQLYPNPSTGDVQLDFTLEQSGRLTIEVSDALGRIIHREEENVNITGPQSRRLRLEAPTGVYTLRLTGGGSSTRTCKLILN